MPRRLLLCLALFSFWCFAQSQPPAPTPKQPQAKTYTLPADKLAKAIEYSNARNRLHFIGAAYGMAILVFLLRAKIAPRFRDWAEAVSSRRFLQAYIFVPLYILASDILGLPLSIYGHHLSRKFEQSIQGWGSWLWDWAKGELIGFLLAGVLVWILYGAIRRSPRRWWFYFWLAAVPILVFMMFVEPLVIEPLFFRFEPLAAKQPALVAEIGKVVARGGLTIPADRMYEMKASEKLNSLNAYVSGIGASKRVVVWDTTIHKMNTGQILFVFSHEMGHYVLHHVWIGIGAACIGILVALFIGFHAMNWALARWGGIWAIRGIGDWASLPVLMLAISILGFVSEPLSNGFSRVLEHNADVYGLEVTHGLIPDSGQVAAESFQILGEVSLDNPNPSEFVKFWLYDHPSISDRVRFSSQYDPWGQGQAPKYVKDAGLKSRAD